MHDEWRYEKNSDDTFTFKCGDDIIIESIDEVWVVVDNHAGIESPVLLKHGSKEKLHKIYDDMVEAYKSADGLDHKDLMLIELTNIPLEDINRCLSSTGYIGRIIKLINTKS